MQIKQVESKEDTMFADWNEDCEGVCAHHCETQPSLGYCYLFNRKRNNVGTIKDWGSRVPSRRGLGFTRLIYIGALCSGINDIGNGQASGIRHRTWEIQLNRSVKHQPILGINFQF